MTLLGAKLMDSVSADPCPVKPELVRVGDPTASLTDRLVRGEEAAFQEFHRLYFDRLYRFLLAITRGQEHSAQDALQETLLRVARYVRVFATEAIFWSWLKMVARSAARDAVRRERRYLAALERLTSLWRSAPGDSALEENDLLDGALADALDHLDPADRHLLEGKYLLGQTVRELAIETGLSDKAVESRLLRLRRQLRADLLHRLAMP